MKAMENKKMTIDKTGGEMFKEKSKKSLFSKLVSSLVIICFVLSSVPMRGYAAPISADKLRPEAVESAAGITEALARLNPSPAPYYNAIEVGKKFDFNPQIAVDFESVNEENAKPWHETAQEFINSIQIISPKSTVVKTAVSQPALPAGTIEVDANQLVGLDVGAVPFGLKMTKIQVTPLKGGNLDLNDESVRSILMSNIPTGLASLPWVGGLKDIKAVIDANAVFIADLGLRNLAKANPKKAYVVLGDEGKRDNSEHLIVGSIYWAGYEGGFKEFATIEESLTELKRLKSVEKISVDGFIGDAVEVTNNTPGLEFLVNPGNTWSLGVLFKEIDSLVNTVNDSGRIAGISGNWQGDAADLNPLDLPSVALRKIAKAEGVDTEGKFAKWMQNVDIFTLGERAAGAEKDYNKKSKKHRHQAIIDDANELVKKYQGSRFIPTGDGTAMPRLVSVTGLSLDGRRIFGFGRDGSNEANTVLMAAKMSKNGHYIHTHVSKSKTDDNLSLDVAHQYTDGNVEKTILAKFEASIKGSIIDPSIKDGIWEVSDTTMRLKPNIVLDENLKKEVKTIAGENFKKVWEILQKAASDEKKEYADSGIDASVYMADRLTEDVIKSEGVVAMTSVNGADETVFGKKFAELLQRIKSNYNADKTGEVTTSTFLATPQGVFVVTTQFAADNLFKTRADLKSASPEAKAYLKNTEITGSRANKMLQAALNKDKARNDIEFSNEVDRILAQDYSSETPEIKANLKRMFGDPDHMLSNGDILDLPIDQELEHDTFETTADNPVMADPFAQVGLAFELRLNGYVTQPGNIKLIAKQWAKRIPLIAKMNSSSNIGGRDKTSQHSFLLGDPEEMAVLGTVAESSLSEIKSIEGTSLDPNNNNSIWKKVFKTRMFETRMRLKPNIVLDEKFKEEVKLIAKGDFEKVWEILQSSHSGVAAFGFTIYPGSLEINEQMTELKDLIIDGNKYGIPVIVWSYPRGGKLSKEYEDALEVSTQAAIMALKAGAHIVKVKPPTEFFKGEQTLAEYKDMFKKINGHEFDAENAKDVALMKHLRFEKLNQAELDEIFAKVKDDKIKDMSALKSKIRPTPKEKLIEKGFEFDTLEKRIALVKYFGGYAGRRKLIFSGGPAKSEEEVLREVAAICLGGGDGHIIGRNLFKREWGPSVKLAQEVMAIRRANKAHQFNSVDDLLVHALQVEFPKVQAEMNLPAKMPAFGPYYEPEEKVHGAQAQQGVFSVAKPSKAVIIDANLLYAVGAEEVIKQVNSLDSSLVVAFYGPGAEALKMLFGEKNIITAKDEMQAIATLKDSMNIAVEKIRFVTTVQNEQVKAAGVKQKVISSLDAVNVLIAINKAIAELDASSEAANIFTSFMHNLLQKGITKRDDAIVKMSLDTVEIVKLESKVAPVQKEAQEKINEFLAKIGV